LSKGVEGLQSRPT